MTIAEMKNMEVGNGRRNNCNGVNSKKKEE